MSVHRLVALLSTTALVGLLGMAQASNNAPSPKKAPRVVVEQGLRERVQNARIDGCGGWIERSCSRQRVRLSVERSAPSPVPGRGTR